jgi:hypothetical protein
MSKRPGKLETLQIPNPCSVGWQNMEGDDKTRFCRACNKPVFNLSAMTRQQAEALLAALRGNLCASLTRNENGMVVTTEALPKSLPRLHQISKRASSVAGAVISAMMAVSPVMAAPAQRTGEPSAAIVLEHGQSPSQAKSEGATTKLSGTVLDPLDAVIVGAKVRLIKADSGEVIGDTISSEDGTYQFEVAQEGTYNLQVEMPGFARSVVENVKVQQGQQNQVRLIMQVGGTVEGGAIAVSELQPLRILYSKSDLIVVATAGQSTKIETDDYPAELVKTALHVSSTLKGKAKSVVYVYHYVYQDDLREFASGNKLLLFLNKSEEDGRKKGGYEVQDANYGIKKLPDADLKIYVQRIEELAKMLRSNKPDPQDLLAWMIRCVENQATRFEGAYELANGVRRIVDRGEEATVEEVAVPIVQVEASKSSDHPSDDYQELALLLTAAQKTHLLNLLFETAELKANDEQLISLARLWKDERLTPFLQTQLRNMQHNPSSFAPMIMQNTADLLNDEELSGVLQEYWNLLNEQYGQKEGETVEAMNARAESVEAIEQRSKLVKKFLSMMDARQKEPAKPDHQKQAANEPEFDKT